MSGGTGVPIGLVVALAGVVGLFVGSFLNVVVYRVPMGLSVAAPRSFCPTCDRQLRWWENIPVASWLALRGRCHRCHEPISARYPLVEAVTALAFAAVAWAWHGSSFSAGYCILAATAIAVALIEYGGARSPLSVAATGAGLGEVALVAPALWLGHWAVPCLSVAGLAVAAATYAVLRLRDPECRDPLGHGRSLLLVAGAWLGGIGGVAWLGGVGGVGGRGAYPVVWGTVAAILAALACLVILWAGTRADRGERRDERAGSRPWQRIAVVPLVTGILAALAVSLTVAG